MASGRVLERDGDVFGNVVNLASRIVNVAYPGAVVVSQDVHDALDHDDRFVFRSLRSHYLKDIGRVPLWSLRSAADVEEQPYARARQRRADRRAPFLGRRRGGHATPNCRRRSVRRCRPTSTRHARLHRAGHDRADRGHHRSRARRRHRPRPAGRAAHRHRGDPSPARARGRGPDPGRPGRPRGRAPGARSRGRGAAQGRSGRDRGPPQGGRGAGRGRGEVAPRQRRGQPQGGQGHGRGRSQGRAGQARRAAQGQAQDRPQEARSATDDVTSASDQVDGQAQLGEDDGGDAPRAEAGPALERLDGGAPQVAQPAAPTGDLDVAGLVARVPHPHLEPAGRR